jgi:hypothetical protein
MTSRYESCSASLILESRTSDNPRIGCTGVRSSWAAILMNSVLILSKAVQKMTLRRLKKFPMNGKKPKVYAR